MAVAPARQPAHKGRRFPAELLSPDEVRALLCACSSRAPTGIRNRALVAVLYRGGLRISEALALRPKDVDQGAGTVTVLHGKGDQRRTIGMDPAAFGLLERWLDKRRSLGLPARRPIFCTLRGEPIDSSYVRRLLPRLAARAGIEKRVHAHGLRHAHAAELAAKGLPANVGWQPCTGGGGPCSARRVAGFPLPGVRAVGKTATSSSAAAPPAAPTTARSRARGGDAGSEHAARAPA